MPHYGTLGAKHVRESLRSTGMDLSAQSLINKRRGSLRIPQTTNKLGNFTLFHKQARPDV